MGVGIHGVGGKKLLVCFWIWDGWVMISCGVSLYID